MCKVSTLIFLGLMNTGLLFALLDSLQYKDKGLQFIVVLFLIAMLALFFVATVSLALFKGTDDEFEKHIEKILEVYDEQR